MRTNIGNRIRRVSGAAAGTGGEKLFTGIIALLSVILAVLIIITAVKVNRRSFRYIAEPDDILRSVKNGYYSDAVEEMYNNIANGETVEKNPDYAVPYAMASYCEAASYYSAYTRAAEMAADAGKAEELRTAAEAYLQEMEEARVLAGDLAFMTEDIDSLFR